MSGGTGQEDREARARRAPADSRSLDPAADDVVQREPERTAELEAANRDLELEVAERRRADEELRVSEAKYRALVDAAPDIIFTVSSDGRILSVNPAFSRVLGWPAADWIGRSFDPLVHPEDRAKAEQNIAAVLRGDPAPHPEIRVLSRTGATLWVESSFQPLLADGRVAALIGVARDITPRKRAEEEHLDQNRILKAIINSMGEGVVVADRSGLFLIFNPAAERILGMGPADIDRARWSGEYGLFLPDQKTLFPAQDLALARALDGRDTDEQVQFIRNGKVPGGVWVSATGRPIRDEGGEVLGGVVVFRDTTLQRQAEESLARSNSELELFATAASHDLQEPLRKIITFGHLLRQSAGGGLVREGLTYLERMEAAADRMSRLIDGLLAYSRVHVMEVSLEPVELDAVLRDVLVDLEGRILESGARVEACPLPRVRANGLQMQQLFQNLIGNALKFCRKGTLPRIVVEGAAEGEFAVITVSDDGIGFEEKFRDRIFQPFTRLHPRGEFEGTGLGLALCARIVQSLGGEIKAESRPGEGASFTLRLPLDREGRS